MPLVRLCVVPSCGRKHRARGLCRKHYDQWRRKGHTYPSPPGRPGQRLSNFEINRLVFMYERLGLSTGQIAEVTGRDQANTYRTLRRAGVKFRNKGAAAWTTRRRTDPLPVLARR